MKFQVHDANTAPAGSRETLANIAEKYGFVPNLAAVFAESPGAMNGLLAGLAAYDNPELILNEIERQVVMLTVSVHNRCAYCTAAHSMLASKLGLDLDSVEDLQQERALPDPRLEALRCFTLAVIEKRGWISDEDKAAFSAAGYNSAGVLEVVLGVALKTLTNYANHITQPPVNEQFSAFLPNWPRAA